MSEALPRYISGLISRTDKVFPVSWHSCRVIINPVTSCHKPDNSGTTTAMSMAMGNGNGNSDSKAEGTTPREWGSSCFDIVLSRFYIEYVCKTCTPHWESCSSVQQEQTWIKFAISGHTGCKHRLQTRYFIVVSVRRPVRLVPISSVQWVPYWKIWN